MKDLKNYGLIKQLNLLKQCVSNEQENLSNISSSSLKAAKDSIFFNYEKIYSEAFEEIKRSNSNFSLFQSSSLSKLNRNSSSSFNINFFSDATSSSKYSNNTNNMLSYKKSKKKSYDENNEINNNVSFSLNYNEEVRKENSLELSLKNQINNAIINKIGEIENNNNSQFKQQQQISSNANNNNLLITINEEESDENSGKTLGGNSMDLNSNTKSSCIANSTSKKSNKSYNSSSYIKEYTEVEEIHNKGNFHTYSEEDNTKSNNRVDIDENNFFCLNFPFLDANLKLINSEIIGTIVLDLDETLVHYLEDEETAFIQIRPGFEEFIEEIANYYEIVVFTAAMQDVSIII